MEEDQQQNPQDPNNFSFEQYVSDLIKKARLHEMPEDMRLKFEEAILERLGSRVVATIVESMSEQDLQNFEVLVSENKELHPLEALYNISATMPHIYEALQKELKVFEDDLLYDIKRLEQFKAPEEPGNEEQPPAVENSNPDQNPQPTTASENTPPQGEQPAA